jgi:predicted O-methyltransferase YrrM
MARPRLVTTPTARAALRDRIAGQRRQLARHGPATSRSDDRDFAAISVPAAEADALRDVLVGAGARTVIEIGLAYGSSALAIGEAIATHDGARHIAIDPFQHTVWADAGWDVLRAAGMDAISTLITEPSALALPRLLTDGLVADAAFVDGSHRFHEVFLDLYFLRRIVRPGGLIVLDDADTAPVATAARYYEHNLDLAAVPDGPLAGSRCRVLRLPDQILEPPYTDFRPF